MHVALRGRKREMRELIRDVLSSPPTSGSEQRRFLHHLSSLHPLIYSSQRLDRLTSGPPSASLLRLTLDVSEGGLAWKVLALNLQEQ